ncbi:MAG: protein kinase, partial [archaeon]|nr:protein kinase [archaeon]
KYCLNGEEKDSSTNNTINNRNLMQKAKTNKNLISPREKTKFKEVGVNPPNENKEEKKDSKKSNIKLSINYKKGDQLFKDGKLILNKKEFDIFCTNKKKLFPQTTLNSRKTSKDKKMTKIKFKPSCLNSGVQSPKKQGNICYTTNTNTQVGEKTTYSSNITNNSLAKKEQINKISHEVTGVGNKKITGTASKRVSKEHTSLHSKEKSNEHTSAIKSITGIKPKEIKPGNYFQKIQKVGIHLPISVTTPVTRVNSKTKLRVKKEPVEFKRERSKSKSSITETNKDHNKKEKQSTNKEGKITKKIIHTKIQITPQETEVSQCKYNVSEKNETDKNKNRKSTNKKEEKEFIQNKKILSAIVGNKQKFEFNNILKEKQISTLNKLISDFKFNLQKDNIKSVTQKNSQNEKLNEKDISDSSINKAKKRNDQSPQKPYLLEHENSSQLSTIRDCNFYLHESELLTQKIKDYYKANKKYPKSDISFYKIGRIIGRGAFGKVNIGLNILTGRIVAIKSFNKKNIENENAKNKILYETNLMRNLRHPSIVKILETFESDKYIFIIMEYISGGNLQGFVKKRRKLNEKTAKFLFRQIIAGIKYIHSQNICHRDIKLENVLIDLNNNVKICDFGVGKHISNDFVTLKNQCGTPVYMAPEIFKGDGYYGYPVDIWSAGVSLYLMLSGCIPFNRTEKTSLQYEIMNSPLKPIKDISNECQDLIFKLLEKDPSKRITAREVLEHPWLKDDESETGNGSGNNHLFTNAEMLLLKKTHIDYRKAKVEDLGENFSIKNLYTADDYNHINNNTKSFILAPYNTMIGVNDYDNCSDGEMLGLEDLEIMNGVIKYCGKVREYNINYELNNNEEIDNGVLINSKFDMQSGDKHNFSSNSLKINVSREDPIEDKVFSASKKKAQTGVNSSRGKNSRKKNKETNGNTYNDDTYTLILKDKIVQMVVELGYKKDYVIKCLEKNELNQATTAYYLFLNYENIK